MKVLTVFLTLFLSSISVASTTYQEWYNDLKAKSSRANFFSAPALIKEITHFKKNIEKELLTEKQSLKRTVTEYEEMFTLLQRLNPLNEETNNCVEKKIDPKKSKVRRLTILLDLSTELLDEVQIIARPVETRTSFDGGICGVFNPDSGLVEWKRNHSGGVAGVYNPNTRKVEWRTRHKSAIAGAYNPNSRIIEWKESYTGGVAGVYNPNTKKVEWKTHYIGGVAGVFNPNTRNVEWNTSLGVVAGVYQLTSRRVEWQKSLATGIAVVYKSQDGTSISSCGFFMEDKEN